MMDAMIVVWLRPPGWPLPEGLPPLGDLAPADPGAPRLAVVRDPVPRSQAAAVAAGIAALPGVARAGWLEPGRVVAIGESGPEPILRRAGGRWEPLEAAARETVDAGLGPDAAAALSAGRLRLVLARRRAPAETGSGGASSGGRQSRGAGTESGGSAGGGGSGGGGQVT